MEIKSNNVVKKFMFSAGALVGAGLLATQQVQVTPINGLNVTRTVC